jgi:hypothetical protein
VIPYDFIQKSRYTKEIYEYQTEIHRSYILQDHTPKKYNDNKITVACKNCLIHHKLKNANL